MIRLLALICTVFMTGCSLGGGSMPADHFYRLPEIVHQPADQPRYKHIVIKPVRTSGLLHDRAMLYVDEQRPLELQRYHYHFWAEAPAYLVQNALIQALSSNSIAGIIGREVDQRRPDLVIEVQLIRFEQLIRKTASEARVELRVSMYQPSKPENSKTRSYLVNQPAQGDDFHAIAAAFGQAMQAITQQLIDDL